MTNNARCMKNGRLFEADCFLSETENCAYGMLPSIVWWGEVFQNWGDFETTRIVKELYLLARDVIDG